MVFDYDYFFENKGICPTCGHYMTVHDGCVNWNCKDCDDKRFADESFNLKIQSIINNFGVNDLISKVTKNDWRKRNLDKREKKAYIKINDKGV